MSNTLRRKLTHDSRDGGRSPRSSEIAQRRSQDENEKLDRRGDGLPRSRRTIGEEGERSDKRRATNDFNREFIKVMVRVRPKLTKELAASEGIHVDGNTLTLTDGRERKHFAVDEVVDSREDQGSQAVVFDRIGRGLLTYSMRGFNVCVFAFGHTGSGKTYTVLGAGGNANDAGDAAGLLPRFIRELFITHERDPRRATTHYSCEFYEVYNETIKDLLAPANSDRTRTVHVHPKHGVRVEGLCCAVMSRLEEVLGLVSFGNQMRTVAATTMNERSSRSHAVFTCRFEQSQQEAQGNRSLHNCESSVTFVDLAGREDQEVSGNRHQQFREMCYINTSLFHLTHLIGKLSDGQVAKGSLSDFRNSKLTLLLHQALVGNSRTALIATVAPIRTHYELSVSTLQFAANVKRVQTKPVINNKTSQAVVSELETEVKALRRQLADAKTSGTEKEQDLLAAQALIDYYKQSFEDALSHSAQEQANRRKTTHNMGLADISDGGFAHPRSSTGQLLPFFTKLSDDPSFQGCCNYYLNKTTMLIGRDEAQCAMIVDGVGIRDVMCEVGAEFVTGAISIEIPANAGEPPPRVVINGHCLQPNTRQTLTHGDSIILGYAHAFRIVVPAEALPGLSGNAVDTENLARASLPNLSLTSAVEELREEHGTQFSMIMPFIQRLSSDAPPEIVNDLLHGLNMLCPLVDEANLITEEVFGKSNTLFFRLHVLTNLFDLNNDKPDLVVCVLQDLRALARFHEEAEECPSSPRTLTRRNTRLLTPGKEKHPEVHALGLSSHMMIGSGEQSSLLYVWSLEKFLRRLKAMRDIYQEGCDGKVGFDEVRLRMEWEPYLDPWREMTFAHVKLFAQDFMAASNILGGDKSTPVSTSQCITLGLPSKVVKANAIGAISAAGNVSSMTSMISMTGMAASNTNGLVGSVMSAVGGVSGPAGNAAGTMVNAACPGTSSSATTHAADRSESTSASIAGVPGDLSSTAPASTSKDPGLAAKASAAAEGFQPYLAHVSTNAGAHHDGFSTCPRSIQSMPIQSSTVTGLPSPLRPTAAEIPKEGKEYPVAPICTGFAFDAGNATLGSTTVEPRATKPSSACPADLLGNPAAVSRLLASSTALQTCRSTALLAGNASQTLQIPDGLPTEADHPTSQHSASGQREITQHDLELLQNEIRTCRAETGRLFAERGRLTGLLDRVDSVLGQINAVQSGKIPVPLVRTQPQALPVHPCQLSGRKLSPTRSPEVRSHSPRPTSCQVASICFGQPAVHCVPTQVESAASMNFCTMTRMLSPHGQLSAPSIAVTNPYPRRSIASRPVTPAEPRIVNTVADIGILGCGSPRPGGAASPMRCAELVSPVRCAELSPGQRVSGSGSPIPLMKAACCGSVHGTEQSLSNIAVANLLPKFQRPTPPSTPRTVLRSTSPRSLEISFQQSGCV